MKELSLHILDLTENSIKAKADLIEIEIIEDIDSNLFSFSIKDNGCGMDEITLKAAVSPFTTSRTTRKVGLGLPLIKQACNLAGGDLYIESKPNEGTYLKATFLYNHIDRQPLGDIATTVALIVSRNYSIDFIYRHNVNGNQFVFDTRELRSILGEIPFDNNDVYEWILKYLKENIDNLYGRIL